MQYIKTALEVFLPLSIIINITSYVLIHKQLHHIYIRRVQDYSSKPIFYNKLMPLFYTICDINNNMYIRKKKKKNRKREQTRSNYIYGRVKYIQIVYRIVYSFFLFFNIYIYIHRVEKIFYSHHQDQNTLHFITHAHPSTIYTS